MDVCHNDQAVTVLSNLLMVWYLLLIMHASVSHTLLEERSLCLSSNVVDSFNIVGELLNTVLIDLSPLPPLPDCPRYPFPF